MFYNHTVTKAITLTKFTTLERTVKLPYFEKEMYII